jgi:hypothetical protein
MAIPYRSPVPYRSPGITYRGLMRAAAASGPGWIVAASGRSYRAAATGRTWRASQPRRSGA